MSEILTYLEQALAVFGAIMLLLLLSAIISEIDEFMSETLPIGKVGPLDFNTIENARGLGFGWFSLMIVRKKKVD